MNEIIKIDISSWAGYDPNASHYYAKLWYKNKDGECEKHTLTYPLKEEDVEERFKKDNSFRWKVGFEVENFNNIDDVISRALEFLEEKNIEPKLIMEGFTSASISECLWAENEEIKHIINTLHESACKIDFYGHEAIKSYYGKDR